MLQVRLLGQFDILADGKRVVIPTRAGQSLFAYLVLTLGTTHRREKLAGLILARYLPDETARRNLRQQLWLIRKALAAPASRRDDHHRVFYAWMKCPLPLIRSRFLARRRTARTPARCRR